MTCRAAINGRRALIVPQNDFPRFEPGDVAPVEPYFEPVFPLVASRTDLIVVALSAFGAGVCLALIAACLGGGF